MMRLTYTVRLTFIAAFCVFIVLPLADGSWGSAPVALEEKRMSSRFPKIEVIFSDPRKYLRQLESYFNDHFGLRQPLVEWQSRLKYFGLGVSSSEDVLLGKDGWLFWAMKRDGDIIGYYRGLKTLSSDDLSVLTDKLQVRTDWLRSRGVSYIFLPAPSKHGIHPEYLPDTVTRLQDADRLGHFLDHARRHTTVSVVDPRPRLLKAKQHWPVYHRTDTHWNAYGAYAAYSALIEVLRKKFPELTPMSLSAQDFERVAGAWSYAIPTMPFLPSEGIRDRNPPGGDIAGILGLGRVLRDESIIPRKPKKRCARVVPTPYRPKGWEHVSDGGNAILGHKGLLTTVCDGKPLKALVIHDSFGPLLAPYLSETFGQITYVWTDQFDVVKDFVENEKVDVVIQIYAERHLLPEFWNWLPS